MPGLLGLVSEAVFGEMFGSLIASFTKGMFSALMSESKENKSKAEKIKEKLDEEGYDPSRLLFKFDVVSKFVFMNGGDFFARMNSFNMVFEIVGIFDENGNELDLADLIAADEEGGDTGDDEDLNGWGDELDSGGFSGWD